MALTGARDVSDALMLVGEFLAADGHNYAVTILGGAALNLLGIVDRHDLVFFKLFAAADSTGPKSVHYQDLLALNPSIAELQAAASWVRQQDASPEFSNILDRVVTHVRTDLELI